MKRGQSIVSSRSDDGLVGCKNCERTFSEDRIATHEEACLKNANRARKPFDMTKKRAEGLNAKGRVPLKGKREIATRGSKVGTKHVSMSKQVHCTLPCKIMLEYYHFLIF